MILHKEFVYNCPELPPLPPSLSAKIMESMALHMVGQCTNTDLQPESTLLKLYSVKLRTLLSLLRNFYRTQNTVGLSSRDTHIFKVAIPTLTVCMNKTKIIQEKKSDYDQGLRNQCLGRDDIPPIPVRGNEWKYAILLAEPQNVAVSPMIA